MTQSTKPQWWVSSQHTATVTVRIAAAVSPASLAAATILTSCLWLAPLSFAGPLSTPLKPPPSRTVQGEILTIQGDVYLVKPVSPAAGKEIRLRVDENTVRIDADTFRIGDVIIADVTPEGHALVITPLLRVETPTVRNPSAATR